MSLVFLIILGTAVVDMPYLAKARRIGELMVIGILLLYSLIYLLDLKYGWNLPTLIQGVKIFSGPLLKFLYGLLS